jgi:ABC-type nitrate/sulfonate/bicarbonate transport system permease component
VSHVRFLVGFVLVYVTTCGAGSVCITSGLWWGLCWSMLQHEEQELCVPRQVFSGVCVGLCYNMWSRICVSHVRYLVGFVLVYVTTCGAGTVCPTSGL